MDRTANIMTATMKEIASTLSESIRDLVLAMKLGLFTALRATEGLIIDECHQALLKIGQS